jgi:hypothetical protein
VVGLGRKRLEHTDAAKVAAIRAMRHKGTGIRRIARQLGVGAGFPEASAFGTQTIRGYGSTNQMQ